MKDVRKYIEKNYKVNLPERLKNFYDNKEYEKYNGLYAHSLIYYQSDLKFEVKFDDKRAFQEADMELNGDIQYVTNIEGKIPLTQLGEEYKFLFVDILTPTLEVQQLEASEGKFYLYRDSFDTFLDSLLTEDEKLPLEEIEDATKMADTLIKQEKHQEALDLLLSILDPYPSDNNPRVADDLKHPIMRAFAKLAEACKGLKKYDQALKNYTNSGHYGNYYSSLDIINTYQWHIKDHNKVIKLAEPLKNSDDDYINFWANTYLGVSQIALNDVAKANNCFASILQKYMLTDKEKIEDATEELSQYIKEKRENHQLATDILTWFKV